MSLQVDTGADRPTPIGGRSARRHRRDDREQRRSPRPSWTSRFDNRYAPYLYIAPFFVLFAIFGLYPLAYTAWVSLHEWDLIAANPTFVGLANYTALLRDADFWNSVVNTLAIFVISTVPQLLLALWLANLLNRGLRARTSFRMGILIPNLTSTAAVAIVFSQLFGREFGLVNWALGLVGVDAIDWHANRFGAWIAVSTMVDWRWTGYNALIFLAAMQAIPGTCTSRPRWTAPGWYASSGPSPCRCCGPRSSSARSSRPSAACNSSPSRCCSTRAPTRSVAARCGSPRRSRCTCSRTPSRRTSTSATARRSPGCCSC
ncbi:hypothetical protein GCM10027614_01600 [Micromonospora vulcania]